MLLVGVEGRERRLRLRHGCQIKRLPAQPDAARRQRWSPKI
jgi:hypothetical protein